MKKDHLLQEEEYGGVFNKGARQEYEAQQWAHLLLVPSSKAE